MILKKSIFILFFIAVSFQFNAQETVKNIDSLLTVLNASKKDTSKVHLYQKIAGHYNVTQLDSAKAFAVQGNLLAKELNYSQGQWINLNTLGNYYERKTMFPEAMETYNKALAIIKETNSTKGFAVVLNNIATIHIKKAEYDIALEYMFDALKAEEELGNRNGIAQAYNNIGVVYYYTQDFDKTTEYLTRALEIQEELGNFDGLINGYNNVGAIFDYQKKYDEAIVSYEKGLTISRNIKDKKMEATQLSNIALAYTNKEDFLNAEKFFTESISIKESINDLSGLARSYGSFGESLSIQKQYTKAKFYLFKGLEISKSNGLKQPEKEIYSTLSKIAQEQNDYKTANTYLQKYIVVKDSILNIDNAKIIAEVETKYETEKKEKEILEQRALLAEKELQVKQKNYIIFGSLGLALILGLIGYLFFNQQKLKNRQLQKENELKTALARIETQNKLQEQRLRISRDLHDNIGAQLTFIISSVDNLKYGFTDISDKLSNKLSGISAFTTQTIYELRDTIWAMNKNNISFEDLQSRITNFIEKAKITSDKTKFNFLISSEVDQDQVFTSVQGMNMYRIIQEGVNNSIKYANASKVEVVFTKDNGLHFEIKDNGIGFNEKEIELGNGLNNMKKRARDLNGTIKLTSEKDQGTSIKISMLENNESTKNK
ncbi:MAG: tetratricopeptide repeat protein [Flavobacteriaceae bacterium]|nr:tetratricopeptide repeat protein [Flavobacteriaceae bacterium]